MHVLDITMYYAAEGGGISSYLNAKADWLARNSRVRHTILSSSVLDNGRAPSVIPLPGIALPGINGYRLPCSLRAPARILQRCRPDVLEVGDAGPCALAALHARRRLQVPLIGFYHSDLHALVGQRFGPRAAALTGKYLRHVYGQFDLVLAPSRLMVHRLGQLGVAGAVHQPLGVDTTVFHPARRDAGLRARLGLPANTRLLVYAGRFTPQKKLGVLIEAVRRLGRPYHLLLIGGGAALPASPNSTILPFERDPARLARLLASCDLLTHPGDGETFGLIALEAMACGLPVLGTGGGVAELIDPGTGLVAEPDSAASLGDGVAALFRADMARLGANARDKACAHFDWNRIMPQLMERYAGLLASRRRAQPDPEGCLAE
ncbi:alpha-1,6-mannosyltransferase [Duganella sp. 1411]|uniref:glycosyltransferase n=1 Tax=Duganella sp. 1411 TaxID=2806572 RepID=UPI001AEB1A9A|nr:glycosyltransferase [Duganella sp. 1411]MBP1204755.1 alpha-1,6-mannosyltransferase [Duganella sp. 1411]